MEEKSRKHITANKLLRAARERRGWSQAALADQVGTTELTIGRWERGERTPQLLYRARLCEIFDMTAEELGLVKQEQTIQEDHAEPDVSLPVPPPQEVFPIMAEEKPRVKPLKSFFQGNKRVLIASVLMLVLVIGSTFGLFIYYAHVPSHSVAANNSKGNHISSNSNSSTPALQDKSFADPAAQPFINDPLTGPDPHYAWHVGHHCYFVDKSYQFHMPNGVNYCLMENMQLQDIEYHITVRILEGTQAGIVFRADDNSRLYYFSINISGRYELDIVDNPVYKKSLLAGDSSAIVPGLNQPNTLAVIARGNTFALFINGQEVGQIADKMFASGHIGVAVGDYNALTQTYTTVAAFVGQKIWKLT